MRSTASIAWPGGKAKAGDQVDADSIPAEARARWEVDGVLVADDDYVSESEDEEDA